MTQFNSIMKQAGSRLGHTSLMLLAAFVAAGGVVWLLPQLIAMDLASGRFNRQVDDARYTVTKIEQPKEKIDCIFFEDQSIMDPVTSLNSRDVGLIMPDGKRKIIRQSYGKGERTCPERFFAVVLDDPKRP